MTKMQMDIYQSFLDSDAVRQSLRTDGETKMTSSTLAAITSLKKLVNHPDLIYDLCLEGKNGFEKVLNIFPPNYKQQNRRLQVHKKKCLLN
jgi:DNA repair and recombination RAD54-like protein